MANPITPYSLSYRLADHIGKTIQIRHGVAQQTEEEYVIQEVFTDGVYLKSSSGDVIMPFTAINRIRFEP